MENNVIEIALTNNYPFRVRQLGLFELDNLLPDSLGPFTYEIEVLGKKYETEFDITTYETPPEKPIPSPSEIKPNSREADQLLDWQLYEAAKLHNKKRQEKIVEFYEIVKQYIIENSCLDSINLLLTEEDWRRVYEVALVPQLTIDLIAKTLASTYAAKFNNQDVLEALKDTKKGRGSYDVIKLWENKLMIQMQKTELEYTIIPLQERARKVCAMFLDEIMTFLELDFDSRLRDAQSKS